MGLKPLGIIGVLLKALKQKDITNIEYEIKLLKQKAGFYISDALIKEIISLY